MGHIHPSGSLCLSRAPKALTKGGDHSDKPQRGIANEEKGEQTTRLSPTFSEQNIEATEVCLLRDKLRLGVDVKCDKGPKPTVLCQSIES